jgi:cephalosporin hydroxylase
VSNLQKVVHDFGKAYYGSSAFNETFYLGVKIVKCPLDLWAYQEIMYAQKPDLIIETGTFCGGSALYLGSTFDALKHDGQVISIDIRDADAVDLPEHPRVEFLTGASSTDPKVLDYVKGKAEGKKVMVILDSDHRKDHVFDELTLYHGLVSPGCTLVIEDTNQLAYGRMGVQAGPAEAIRKFKPDLHGFVRDKRWERFLFTCNPGGYFRRLPS